LQGGVQGGCDGTECDSLLSPQISARISSSGMGGRGGIQERNPSSRSKSYVVNKSQNNFGASTSLGSAAVAGHGYSRDDSDVMVNSSASAENGGGACGNTYGNTGRETHSCPSSPTENSDCSSGFSTLRRRSVTVTEKVRNTIITKTGMASYIYIYSLS